MWCAGGVGVFCVHHVMFPGVMFDGAGWGFKCCASAMESTGWCFVADLIKFGCVLGKGSWTHACGGRGPFLKTPK